MNECRRRPNPVTNRAAFALLWVVVLLVPYHTFTVHPRWWEKEEYICFVGTGLAQSRPCCLVFLVQLG